jgi:hypothetical protein
MRRIDIAERRARLGVRHLLARPAKDAAAVARSLVALHATDPATVFLAIQARTSTVDIAAIERALYEERSLIRMLGMRRTMFVLPVEEAAMLHASCGQAVAAQVRRRYIQLLTQAEVGDGAFLADVEDATERALIKRGEATGAELSTDEPRLRTTISLAEDKSYGGPQNITSWVLLLLAADGRTVRGRPRGTWTSSQWRWSPVRTWLPDGLPELPAGVARAALVRQWLATFGPGTVADLKWWTGWTAGQVKQALTAIGPVEVDLDGETGLVLAEDVEAVKAPKPWVALLPGLDPTPMGWAGPQPASGRSGRSWFLGEHGPALFDRNGNVGPTVWVDGRIVGGWAQRASGEVVFRLLEDVGTEATRKITTAAAALSTWIGPARITPRFRTPLERTLTT